MKVSECQKGQKVWRGSVFRSNSGYGKPWYVINEFTVLSPELSVVGVGSYTNVVGEDVFLTKSEAIQHMIACVAGFISELEDINTELRAQQIESAAA